jgi:aspartate/methionine/tyrosine aminotransferase
MDEYETSAKYNLAETCCASISVDELLALSEDKTATVGKLLDSTKVQGYGEIRGSSELRNNLSRLYSSKVGTPLPAENILITPGAIAANHLTLYSLVGPGDHVICHYPTYQQLYSIPESLGAEVSLWKSKADNKWLPDLEELKALVTPNTKLIIIKHVPSPPPILYTLLMIPSSNPQNPTGAILPKSLIHALTDYAESKSIPILSDEVYRPLFHSISPLDDDFPPSLLSAGYSNTIATGSLSKAYSLAGLRVGWIASRNRDLIEQIAKVRDYTTISVSQLDQSVAAFALSPDTIHALLGRNIALAKANLALLERFVIKHDEYCSWVKPVAGTTAFVKFEREGKLLDAVALCKSLQASTGVMLLPGDCFGEEFKGYVRVGYVNREEVVKEGLEKLRLWMRKEFDDVPLLQ